MLRLAPLLLLFNFFNYLAADDYANCRLEVEKSYKFFQGKHSYQTPFGWLLFSKEPIENYQRSEPLLGLYLLNEKQKKAALKVLKRHPKNVAAITKAAFAKNRIVNEGLGLDRLAVLKEPSFEGTALFGACCTLRGFVTPYGVVTSDYLLRFLKQKKPFATAGIRLKEIKGKIIVAEVNPFFASNPFVKGDEILFMDGKGHTLATLTNSILFSKVGSKHAFRIKRQGLERGVQIYLKERLGGGVLAETYIEQYGFRFNRDLEIVFIDNKSIAYQLGLKTGDTLRSINNISVKSDKDVRDFFIQGIPDQKLRLLFERSGLQFNAYIPNNIMLTLHK